MKKSLSILFCSFLFSWSIAFGNGITLTNLTSVSGSGYVQLQFDLTWDNSWNNAISHDAAWVFFKFKDNDGTWRHLNLTNANNNITSGYTINVPSDNTGAMIYRNSGTGIISLVGVQLGVTNLPGSFDVKGFAIEMVQIPLADPYYLGDGQAAASFYHNGVSGTSFLVNANNINMGTSAGQLNDGLGNGTLATGFPIGYNSAGPSLNLYMMKHEVSQAAYRDFLNTLTYTQQVKRTAAAPNSVAGTMAIGLIAYRNGIKISTPGVSATTPAVYGCDLNNNSVYNETTDGEWVACGYLAYMDMAAFLDWAALRPMTELEFEKSCRGPLVPVSGEFAPGTATSSTYTFPLNNAGTTNESITYSGSVLNANINHNLASPGGNSPTRVGIHATAGATRISAGAGYYGVLDLSGNLLESCVTTGNVAGRSFTGVNGNGELNSAGDADVNFWPGINGNVTTTAANSVYGGATGVTGAAGIFSRGGACGYNPSLSQTSDRSYALAGTSTRIQVIGGRGVKSW